MAFYHASISSMFKYLSWMVRSIFGGRSAPHIKPYVTDVQVIAKLKYYLTLRRIKIEAISYPATKQITSAKILATIGDTTKMWYSYQEFLGYGGAGEELERWFRV